MIPVIVRTPPDPGAALLQLVRGMDLAAMNSDQRYRWFQNRLGIHRGAQMASVFHAALCHVVVAYPEEARQLGYEKSTESGHHA